MRFITTFILIIVLQSINAQQNIGIGTTSPDSNAILDIASTSKGILIPRMSTTQRTQINNPVVGLLVFDTDTESFWFKETAGWTELKDGNIKELSDADNNTKVMVEETPDDNSIRFETNGTEYFNMSNGRLNVLNTGNSVFVGSGAGQSDDFSDNENVFIGEDAGYMNTVGTNNCAVGFRSLLASTSSDYNTATGSYSLTSNTSGNANVAFGYDVMPYNTTGGYNSGFGTNSLFQNTTGDSNVGIGAFAGRFNQAGSNNVLIGYIAGAGISAHNKNYNVMIGNRSGQNNMGNSNVFIGNYAGHDETGSNKLYIANSGTSNPLIYGEFNNNLVRINGDLNVTNTMDVDGMLSVHTDANVAGKLDVMDSLHVNNGINVTGNSSIAGKLDVVDSLHVNNGIIVTGNSNVIGDMDITGVLTNNGISVNLPVGSIQMWATNTPPEGWLICDGTTFNASTYPLLNAVLGGNTLPDFAGRFPLGVGNSGANGSVNHTIGGEGGEEKHTLTIAEMPSHNHGIQYRVGTESGSGNNYSDLTATGTNDTTENTGGDQPHNTMPPYYTINFIIKAK